MKMTTTVSNFQQPTRRPSSTSSSSMIMMMASCSPPSLGFNSVLYSPSMKEDPSDEILNGDKRSAHNALERQRREGLNNKFQQLAHVLPGLQNVRRPSKSMIVSKSLEFVSKSVQRDTTYQNKIKQLRKEYQTLRKHAQQQQQFKEKKKNKNIPSPLLSTTSPLKQKTISKKPTTPIRHKFVHHHASASSPENKSCPQTPQQQSQQQQHQQQQMTAVSTCSFYPTPPIFQEFTIQPSWPPLDLSGALMDYPLLEQQQQQQQQQQQALPFYINDLHQTTFDPSYTYFWK